MKTAAKGKCHFAVLANGKETYHPVSRNGYALAVQRIQRERRTGTVGYMLFACGEGNGIPLAVCSDGACSLETSNVTGGSRMSYDELAARLPTDLRHTQTLAGRRKKSRKRSRR